MKAKHFHYHLCDCGKWGCNDATCNLSKHAKCGFKQGNDFTTCVKHKAPPVPLKFEVLAGRLITGEITRKRFLCDAIRLNLNGEQAKQQLREYRKEMRREFKPFAVAA